MTAPPVMAIEAVMDEPPEQSANPQDKQRPRMTERARAAKEERDRRLAEALRENLRRRKAQARSAAPSAAIQPESDDQT